MKDHVGDRTVDLSYMIQRELLLPFGDWVNQVRAARNQYAQAHNRPAEQPAVRLGATLKPNKTADHTNRNFRFAPRRIFFYTRPVGRLSKPTAPIQKQI